jgi:hypothetical protein
MVMKVMVVPLHYTVKDTVPLLGEEQIKLLHDEVLQQNPLQEIEIEIHDPVDWSTTLSDNGAFFSILPAMKQLRSQEDAPPNVYYAALVDPGCPVIGCAGAGVAGVAEVTSPTQSDGVQRVSANVWYNPTTAVRTVNHEIGHNQGLSHVACPGQSAAGPNPAYPYAEGKIGIWGFGIRNYEIHRPDRSYDYMSYCGPTWASDWTWHETYERIRTLTSWDNGGPLPPDDGPRGTLITGIVTEDGESEWVTLHDEVLPATQLPEHSVRFLASSSVLAEQPASVRQIADGEALSVTVAVPDDFEEVDAIELVGPQRVTAIDPGHIDRVSVVDVVR